MYIQQLDLKFGYKCTFKCFNQSDASKDIMGVGVLWKAPNLSSGQTAQLPFFQACSDEIKTSSAATGVCVVGGVHQLLNRINLTVRC